MSKYRQAARVDSNQEEIVKQLRDIPGVSVSTGKDDILVGFKGKTFWFELKVPDVFKKNGEFKRGAIKNSQLELLHSWEGHYSVVWSIEQLLQEIGVIHEEKR